MWSGTVFLLTSFPSGPVHQYSRVEEMILMLQENSWHLLGEARSLLEIWLFAGEGPPISSTA